MAALSQVMASEAWDNACRRISRANPRQWSTHRKFRYKYELQVASLVKRPAAIWRYHTPPSAWRSSAEACRSAAASLSYGYISDASSLISDPVKSPSQAFIQPGSNAVRDLGCPARFDLTMDQKGGGSTGRCPDRETAPLVPWPWCLFRTNKSINLFGYAVLDILTS